MSTIKKNLGGDRLGSGNKNKVELHNYERSTHDLSSLWRSTMAAGTLVPFFKKLALPGDSWEINLDADIMTYPTVGPLFGSFKLQLDLFVCPMRLYQGKLHNNALGIGMQMQQVKLPQIEIECNDLKPDKAIFEDNYEPIEFQQINQSAILAYLGIRGVGKNEDSRLNKIKREFNAVPFLAYWDIVKNYYTNKQEEIGAVIHSELEQDFNLTKATGGVNTGQHDSIPIFPNKLTNEQAWENNQMIIHGTIPLKAEVSKYIDLLLYKDNEEKWFNIREVWNSVSEHLTDSTHTFYGKLTCGNPIFGANDTRILSIRLNEKAVEDYQGVKVVTFPLSNLDDMRNDLLLDAKKTTPYKINKETYAPYGLLLKHNKDFEMSAKLPLEGLAVKTYQSDIFNNWLSTEWLENENGTGINQITAVSTQEGNFQIDALILAKKVYDMLNRIAVSGGSYDDWLEAVWAHDSYRRAESPIYMGGLSREVIFQEVVSNSRYGEENSNEFEPLGSLAGKGRLSDKKKGGYVKIKIDEPSYIIGIASLTPRIDYSQGNEFDMNLKTMDDFHKPALDGIGFQSLLTDQMLFSDTQWDNVNSVWKFKSAGKVPAWVNYMTDINKTYGNFADSRKEMFMTLNRRYMHDTKGNITDLTTYIDPAKFNYMFAHVDRSAQNFWVQIASDVTARRKMSAKIMPNL